MLYVLVSGVEAAQRMYVELPTDSSNLYAAIYSENKVAAITENSVGFGIDGDGNPTRYVTVAFLRQPTVITAALRPNLFAFRR